YPARAAAAPLPRHRSHDWPAVPVTRAARIRLLPSPQPSETPVTNYGALAILAIPGKVLDSDLRLMIALETVTPDAHGDRKIGMKLLAQMASLPYGTARDARTRLVAAGWVIHKPGCGRGQFSTFRITLSLKVPDYGPTPSGEKVPGQDPAPSQDGKVLDPPAK